MKVICYGDSNTYGFDPRSYLGERYAPESRWVDVLAQISGWNIRNVGMNGRAIPRTNVSFPEDVDCIIIMLGTNDLLQGISVMEALQRMERFLLGLENIRHKLVIIAPPKMQRGEWVNDERLIDASVAFAVELKALCVRMELRYVDNTQWDLLMCYDGVHFTESAHRKFAECLYHRLSVSE